MTRPFLFSRASQCGSLRALTVPDSVPPCPTAFLAESLICVGLFSQPGVRPPLWFRRYRWPEKVTHVTSKFLPAGAAVRARDFGGFSVVSSAPERAILECLLLAPERMDLVETYGLLENLRMLRPQVMQSLLEGCSSVKVKRLFMFLAERAGLPVVAKLARGRIDLGKGARSIVPKGAYVAKYEIVVPRALVRE